LSTILLVKILVIWCAVVGTIKVGK